ncbi:MAG: hypothetical protein ACK5U4_05060 [Rhodospirillales bacterium]|jgi:hypothetical protein
MRRRVSEPHGAARDVARTLAVWAGIKAAGGPAHMARVWDISERLAQAYANGERVCPAKHLPALAAELRAQAARALKIAAKLAPTLGRKR